VAADLNGLVKAPLVDALCPPPDPALFPQGMNTPWLKPGRCLWQWWAFDDPGTHWSKQMDFVDKAAELACEYYLDCLRVAAEHRIMVCLQGPQGVVRLDQPHGRKTHLPPRRRGPWTCLHRPRGAAGLTGKINIQHPSFNIRHSTSVIQHPSFNICHSTVVIQQSSFHSYE
jgi:hypothetical protein